MFTDLRLLIGHFKNFVVVEIDDIYKFKCEFF